MRKHLVPLAVLLADLAASALLWRRLPKRVPVHWDFAGEVDRYGSRWELLAFGPAVLLLLWGLLAVIGRIDPKAQGTPDPEAPPAELGTRDTVLRIVLALVALVHVVALLNGAGVAVAGPRLHALIMAGFMLALGNALGRVRPNFFVGIRTPWTLSDDQVWRRTHRAGGRLLFGGGLLGLLCCAVLPAAAAFGTTLGLLVATLLAPAIASYFWWRASRRAG